ncbi:hypothetical protein OE88DRAFT_1640399 [Heliocybe sulcata]|uniref:Uncharacterized protein n=1 Tax=Heliocybe sulcata TaxID=5364 RepID=A0A5C3NGC7_9AGAM|nr:hypothetical protein OE88DRAFT_1640399 [Heliocybe sulcata]
MCGSIGRWPKDEPVPGITGCRLALALDEIGPLWIELGKCRAGRLGQVIDSERGKSGHDGEHQERGRCRQEVGSRRGCVAIAEEELVRSRSKKAWRGWIGVDTAGAGWVVMLACFWYAPEFGTRDDPAVIAEEAVKIWECRALLFLIRYGSAFLELHIDWRVKRSHDEQPTRLGGYTTAFASKPMGIRSNFQRLRFRDNLGRVHLLQKCSLVSHEEGAENSPECRAAEKRQEMASAMKGSCAHVTVTALLSYFLPPRRTRAILLNRAENTTHCYQRLLSRMERNLSAPERMTRASRIQLLRDVSHRWECVRLVLHHELATKVAAFLADVSALRLRAMLAACPLLEEISIFFRQDTQGDRNLTVIDLPSLHRVKISFVYEDQQQPLMDMMFLLMVSSLESLCMGLLRPGNLASIIAAIQSRQAKGPFQPVLLQLYSTDFDGEKVPRTDTLRLLQRVPSVRKIDLESSYGFAVTLLSVLQSEIYDGENHVGPCPALSTFVCRVQSPRESSEGAVGRALLASQDCWACSGAHPPSYVRGVMVAFLLPALDQEWQWLQANMDVQFQYPDYD